MTLKGALVSEVDVDLNSRGSAAPDDDALKARRLEQELAYSFGFDISNVSRIIQKWISYMYLRLDLFPIWPDWCDVEKTMPEMFRKSYPDTFIIVDAAEIKCESPSDLSPQSQH